MPITSNLPVVLSIAGTDPSGGAGIQADLKTFTARNTLGTSVITALVAQNTQGVQAVSPVPLNFVRQQFTSLLEDMPILASKSGMLANQGVVELLVELRQQGHLGFFTLDPVLLATSGHSFLEAQAITSLKQQLIPLTDLITPNLPEAAFLLGQQQEAQTLTQMQEQALALQELGAQAVLLKGGHGTHTEVINLLVTATGQQVVIRHKRIRSNNTHGTGCTLAAAITAEIGYQLQQFGTVNLSAAVANSIAWLVAAIQAAQNWRVSLNPQGGRGPVNHQVGIVPERMFNFDLNQTEIYLNF